jgi:hypothetical protein
MLSLIASTVNEIIFSFFNMRGKELLRGLKTLLDDDNATGLVKRLYNHGQIFGLFEGDFDPKKPGKLPSYIPAQNFVMAFLDIVPDAAHLSPAGNVQKDVPAMVSALRTAALKLAGDPTTEKVGKPLVSMIDAAGNDPVKLEKSIEDWYNSAMDRVSGWYKYRTQWALFAIGLVIAVALNANSIAIVKQLSIDSTLRQSIVAAAQSAKQPDSTSGQPIKDQIRQAEDQVSQISNLGIPLGLNQNELADPGAWPQMLLGWLLTAIAVSLGAPFWFDILNKFMVVRSTVKPREKSHEEQSKDKD